MAQPINLWSAAEFTELYLIAKTNSLFLSPSRECAGSGIPKTAIEEAPGLGTGSRHIGIDRSTSLLLPDHGKSLFP